jgi:antitoxin component YwqK of YwqJK toxin-antitoxin module
MFSFRRKTTINLLNNNIINYILSEYLTYHDLYNLNIDSREKFEYKIQQKSTDEQGHNYVSQTNILINDIVIEQRWYYWNNKVSEEFIVEEKNLCTLKYSKKGKLVSEQNDAKSGLLNGFKKEYYPNGQLKYLHYYINGQQDGIQKGFFPDGFLIYELYYNNGVKIGMWKGWWNNGNLFYEHHFDHKGKKVGIHKRWYKNGTLKYEAEYKNNIIIRKQTFYDEIEEEEMKRKRDDKFNRRWKRY